MTGRTDPGPHSLVIPPLADRVLHPAHVPDPEIVNPGFPNPHREKRKALGTPLFVARRIKIISFQS